MTISERLEAGRRDRRVLTRVSRAAWRLEQAERERTWALVSARAEGISIRTLATAIGLSPSRVHQIVAVADLDAACDEDGCRILNESLSGSAHGFVGSVGSGDNDEVARPRAIPFVLVSGSSVPRFLR